MFDRSIVFRACLWATAALLCGCSKQPPAPAPAPAEDKTAPAQPPPDTALESARSTATVFLTALRNSDDKTLFGMLSRGYRERLSADEQKRKEVDLLTFSKAIRVRDTALGNSSVTATKDRATFDGTYRATNHVDSSFNGPRTFTLVLAMDKEENTWKVDVFTVGQ